MDEEINKVTLIDIREIDHLGYEAKLLKGNDVVNGTWFSSLLDKVIPMEDVSAYLDVDIQEVGDKLIHELYVSFFSKWVLKDKHKKLETSNLRWEVDIPNFSHREWVRFSFHQINEKYM